MEIGKLYTVPCIRRLARGRKVFLPILGGRHSDPELGNPNHHYHIDYRFMSSAFYEWLIGHPVDPDSIQVQRSDNDVTIYHKKRRLHRHFVTHNADGVSECGTIGKANVFDFEELMSKAKVIKRDGCKFCPHKGTPLEDAVEIRPGQIQCPAHYLVWNKKTGSLIRRGLPLADCPS